MIDVVVLWYALLFSEILAISFISLHRLDLRYVYFAITAAVIGRIFDCSAVFLGFYSYNPVLDPAHICGTPITVAFAEGMGLSIAIFAFESLSEKLKIKY